MLIFLKFLLISLTIFELIFNDFFDISDDFSIHSLFIYFFFIVMFLNIRINKQITFNKFDFDMLYKYILLFFKTPSFLGNYTINYLKQILYYLNYFKYRNFKNSIKLIYKKYFSNFFTIWRPLFKKTSYFGYYRSNRSKWIK